MKANKGTIIRTAVLALALINTALQLFNKSPLPIDNETIEKVVSFIFMLAASLAAWWKNNSFRRPAIQGDILKNRLKMCER